MVETLLPIPPDSQPEAASGDTTPAAGGDTALPADRGQPPTPSGIFGFLSAGHVALAVVAIVLGWSYAPNLRGLVATWIEEPNYSHGFLVVPVALVMVWRRWVEEDRPALTPSWWGWAGLAVMLIVRAVCYERGAEWTETATLLPVIACLTWAGGGWPLLRRVWPAIAFLVFLLPLPLSVNSLLAQPLQRVATTWSTALLKLTGLWVVAEGNVILVGGDQLEVAAACNGLSMLMCLAATVAAMTILVPMAVWKRIALFLSIIPIALASNVLRIAATAWCYHLFGAQVGGHFAHGAAGVLMMPLALVLVGLELGLLSWLVTEVEELPAGRPDHLLRRRPT